MVRTRGLGRALGTGRGRETTQDVPKADVPWHCRPTASARRQRVRVPEDVAQRPEDVPQLHEDVPHVSDATSSRRRTRCLRAEAVSLRCRGTSTSCVSSLMPLPLPAPNARPKPRVLTMI